MPSDDVIDLWKDMRRMADDYEGAIGGKCAEDDDVLARFAVRARDIATAIDRLRGVDEKASAR